MQHRRPDCGLGLLRHPPEGSGFLRLIDQPADVGGQGGEAVRVGEPEQGGRLGSEGALTVARSTKSVVTSISCVAPCGSGPGGVVDLR